MQLKAILAFQFIALRVLSTLSDPYQADLMMVMMVVMMMTMITTVLMTMKLNDDDNNYDDDDGEDDILGGCTQYGLSKFIQ